MQAGPGARGSSGNKNHIYFPKEEFSCIILYRIYSRYLLHLNVNVAVTGNFVILITSYIFSILIVLIKIIDISKK